MNANKTDPEQLVAELREIQKQLPFTDDGEPTDTKLDAESILSQLTSIRARLPFLAGVQRQSEEARTRSIDDMPIETEEDFELAAVLEGIESLHADLAAAIEQKRNALEAMGLEIYYAAEEASSDPANAQLIEQVEAMRAAYEREYGRPIPPKGKK